MLACVCFFRRPRETWLRWYAQQHMPSWFLRKLQGSLHGHEPEFLPHLWPHCCGGGLSGGHIAHSESAMIGGVSGKCLPPPRNSVQFIYGGGPQTRYSIASRHRTHCPRVLGPDHRPYSTASSRLPPGVRDMRSDKPSTAEAAQGEAIWLRNTTLNC